MKNINWKSGFKRIAVVLLAAAIGWALMDAYDAANYLSHRSWWIVFFANLGLNLLGIGVITVMVLTIGAAARYIYRGFTSPNA